MATNIKIIHSQDFIRAKPDGVLDLTASRNLLKDLVSKVDMGCGSSEVGQIGQRLSDQMLTSKDIDPHFVQ